MTTNEPEQNNLGEPNRRLEHINQVLKAVRNVNQLIFKARNRDELLQGACDCLTEMRGYFNAWIALFNKDRKLVAHFESGLNDIFLPMGERLESGNLPSCVLKVLAGKPIISIDDPFQNCADCPLAPDYGGHGGIATGLIHEGHIYGVLVVSTPRDYMQDTEECDLLVELAEDLGYALNNLEQADVLQETRELLLQSQQIAHIGSWSFDLATSSLEWTEEVYRIFGLSPLVFKPTYAAFLDKVHPDDRALVDNAYLQSLENNLAGYEIEHRILRQDTGEIRFVHEKCTHIKGPHGKVSRSLGIVQDITERKKIQERLELVIKASNDAPWDWDLVTDLLYYSPQWWQQLGMKPDDMPVDSRLWFRLVHPDDKDRVNSFLENALENQTENYEVEFRLRHKEGHYVPILSRGLIVRDHQGKAIRISGTNSDQTKQKRADEELRHAYTQIQNGKELLDATNRMAKVGGWELDAKTKQVTWTEETYRIHEVPLDSRPLLEKAVDFFHPEDRPILEQSLREALNEGKPYDLELRLTTAKGKDLFTRTICTPIIENEEVVRLLGTFQDITERKRAEEVLAKSEETLRITLESIGDAVISTDTKTHVVFMNPVAESLTGWSAEDANGQPLETIFHILNEQTRAPVESPVEKSLKSGQIVELANHTLLIAKNGREIPIADSSAPILNDEGRITGVVLVFRDQTKERATRQELESSYELLQIAGETSKFGGWSVDLEKGVCNWSDIVADIHGMPHGYTIPIEEGITFYAPEWREKITEVFTACAENGIPYDEQMEIITKKGRRLWVRTCGKAVRNEEGQIVKVQGSFQDITEIKKAEDKIRAMEKQNAALLDTSPVCHKIVDLDLNLQYMNSSGFKMLGLEKNDLLFGKPYPFDFFPEQCRHDLINATKQVIETGNRVEIETKACDFSGNDAWLYHSILPVKDEDGTINYLTVVTADITEQKEMQARISHSEKMDAIGHLAGGVAHDFNNQLTGVLGYADMLIQRLDDPTLKLYAENIYAAALRSKDLTMKLLAFSRKGHFQSVPIDVHKLIHETIDILLHSIDKRICIKQEFNTRESTTTGDPTSIQNALLNICVNARDAMPDGGTLAITTNLVEVGGTGGISKHSKIEDGKYIAIKITDTGCGIAPEIISHVFEPFYTTKPEGKGTGMGLSAVYGTVKKHGGDITLRSKEGEGTCVEILLPLSPSGSEDSFQEEKEEKTNIPQSLTILLVEDEESVRNFESELFSSLGHTVLCASNGQEAVTIYGDEWREIDIVILDMIMPIMGGKKTFQKIKKINPEVKVILASGYSIEEEAQSILDKGAVGFIQKPFTIAQLLKEIKRIFSEDDANQ